MTNQSQLTYKQIEEAVKHGNLHFYNFYNLDMSLEKSASVNYNFMYDDYDNVDQFPHHLSVVFNDIETFPDNYPYEQFDFIDNGKITANTLYSTKDKTFNVYFLISDELFESEFIFDNADEERIKKYLSGENEGNHQYIRPDEKISYNFFRDEKELIKSFMRKLREIDPMILSGFNSHVFDYPYIYRRCVRLFGEDYTNKLFSPFGTVELQNPNTIKSLHEKKEMSTDNRRLNIDQTIRIPGYEIIDLLHLYKPRSERFRPGLNYGVQLPNYTLDAIIKKELGFGKEDYKSLGYDIFNFYYKDPKFYLLYNIVDVVACVRLHEKTGHIDLHNLLRRRMYTPLSVIHGNSAFFDTFCQYEYKKQGKDYVRFGKVKEKSMLLEESAFFDIPIPLDNKNKKVLPLEVINTIFMAVTTKYPGASVKNVHKPRIIRNNTVVDLDASSLYPFTQIEYNISVDTYIGKIINPMCSKIINSISDFITNGYDEFKLNQMSRKIWELIMLATECDGKGGGLSDMMLKKCSKQVKAPLIIKNVSKQKTKQYYYYIFMYLFKRLVDSGLEMKDILSPVNERSQIALNYYLLPLLNMFEIMHPSYRYINEWCYEYYFDSKFNDDKVYYIENMTGPNKNIRQFTNEEFMKYSEGFILTISGDTFFKHEDKMGMFTDMLFNSRSLRVEYESRGLENIGRTIKIVMNSCYGYLGLKTSLFGDVNLARAITTLGRLQLKLAQFSAEDYLTRKYDGNPLVI